MNVTTEAAIRLGAEPVTRAGWSCPGCGVNYSPDVASCSCTARPSLPAQPVMPSPLLCTCGTPWNSISPPPPCPAHGQAQVITVTCSGVNDVPGQVKAEISRAVRASASQVRF